MARERILYPFHIMRVIIFVILVFHCVHGITETATVPMVVIELDDDSGTIADEYLIVAAESGQVGLIGFIVSHSDETDRRLAGSRLKELIARTRVISPLGGPPWVMDGALKPLSLLSRSRADGSSILEQVPASTTLVRQISRLSTLDNSPLYFLSLGPLTTLAHVLEQRSSFGTRIHLVGPFGGESPPEAISKDRRAWKKVMESGIRVHTWQSTAGGNSAAGVAVVSPSVPFHPSELSGTPYSENWLFHKLWSPFSTKGYVGVQHSLDDALLQAACLVSDKGIVGSSARYSAENLDGESVWNKDDEGSIQLVESLNSQAVADRVRETFLRWGQFRERISRPSVILDGDYANGITDLSAALRLLYGGRGEIRGFGISSFSLPGLNYNSSLLRSRDWLVIVLANDFQFERDVYNGIPPLSSGLAPVRDLYNPAPPALVRIAGNHSSTDRLNVIVTGPLTNIAAALNLAPAIAPRLHVWMTGARPGENGIGWTADSWHYHADRTAFTQVMNNPNLMRTVLPDNLAEPWVFNRNELTSRLTRFNENSWWIVNDAWTDFLNVWSGKSIGLTANQAHFTELAIVEAFLDTGLVVRKPAGFSHGSGSGGTFWIESINPVEMEKRFIDAISRGRQSAR